MKAGYLCTTFLCLAGVSQIPANASETVTYSYDALGRLVASSTSGGPNDGVATSTQFDPAGNRTNYSVTGSTASNAAPHRPGQPRTEVASRESPGESPAS